MIIIVRILHFNTVFLRYEQTLHALLGRFRLETVVHCERVFESYSRQQYDYMVFIVILSIRINLIQFPVVCCNFRLIPVEPSRFGTNMCERKITLVSCCFFTFYASVVIKVLETLEAWHHKGV